MSAPRRHHRWHSIYHAIFGTVTRDGWSRSGWLHSASLWLDRGSRDRYYRRADRQRKQAGGA